MTLTGLRGQQISMRQDRPDIDVYGAGKQTPRLRDRICLCARTLQVPGIDLVEGHDPRKEARAMFAAVQARCASNQTVRYLTRDGRTLEAPCAKALAEPAAWVIEHAPRLSLP